MSFFDDSSSGFPGFGGDGGFFGSSAAPFATSSVSSKGGEGRTKPEGRKSGGAWSGADNSGFWSEEGASFSSPAPSQTQGGSGFQRRGGSGSSAAALGGGGGLIYATVGMLLRAADEAAGNRRGRTQQQRSSKGEAETPPDESSSSSSTSGLKLQLHGQEITTVGLRGWVSAAGAQRLPSAVRFVLCDGTGEIDVEVGLVEGRPWWGDSSDTSRRQAAAEDDAAAAAALWNFPHVGGSPGGLKGTPEKGTREDAQHERETTADEPADKAEGGAQEHEQEGGLQDSSCSKNTEPLSNTKKFLDPGSLVRVTGALLLLANDGAAARRESELQGKVGDKPSKSVDSDGETAADEDRSSHDMPRVYLEAITCSPIKDAREFSVLHPVEVAFAAATFLSRSGRLQQSPAVSAAPVEGKKKAKLQEKGEGEEDEEEDESKKPAQSNAEEESGKAESLKLLQQEYGHLEDPVQQKVVLFLLQHGDSEKRVSKQRLLTHLCADAVPNQRCSTEQVERALQELEEAAETIEHAGLVALAC